MPNELASAHCEQLTQNGLRLCNPVLLGRHLDVALVKSDYLKLRHHSCRLDYIQLRHFHFPNKRGLDILRVCFWLHFFLLYQREQISWFTLFLYRQLLSFYCDFRFFPLKILPVLMLASCFSNAHLTHQVTHDYDISFLCRVKTECRGDRNVTF